MKRILLLTILIICFPFQSVYANNSYAVVDGNNGRLLYGSNVDAQLPIASLTKVWTALVTLENSELDEEVKISKRAATAEGSLIYLKEGEKRTVEQLLYGLMLRSGNDAATALAEHVGGSVEGFVKLMNDKANIYNLQQTVFTNPSGLPDVMHLSSAYDMGVMLSVAMKNKDFKKIASTEVYADEQVHWLNKHRLIGENNAIAGKTGFTKAAGRTLATYYEKDGVAFSVVTLNEPDDWRVHTDLAKQTFSEYELSTVVPKGKHKVEGMVVEVKSPIKLTLAKEEEQEIEHVLQIIQKTSEAYWHIYLNGERIKSSKVKFSK